MNQRYERLLDDCVDRPLTQTGFKRNSSRGKTWRREGDGLWQVVEAYRFGYSTADNIDFTPQWGFVVPGYRQLAAGAAPDAEPQIFRDDADVYGRLHELDSNLPVDWNVSPKGSGWGPFRRTNVETDARTAQEISAAIAEVLIPFFERTRTVHGLLRYIRDGVGKINHWPSTRPEQLKCLTVLDLLVGDHAAAKHTHERLVAELTRWYRRPRQDEWEACERLGKLARDAN